MEASELKFKSRHPIPKKARDHSSCFRLRNISVTATGYTEPTNESPVDKDEQGHQSQGDELIKSFKDDLPY